MHPPLHDHHRAYAKLGHNPLRGRLVRTMMDRLGAQLESFPSQELVNSLWGAATLHPAGVPVCLLQRVESHAAGRLMSCLPLQVSALLSSFASLRYVPQSPAFCAGLDSTLRCVAVGGDVVWEDVLMYCWCVVFSMSYFRMSYFRMSYSVWYPQALAVIVGFPPLSYSVWYPHIFLISSSTLAYIIILVSSTPAFL